MTRETVEKMRQVGVHPSVIYAFEQTGLLVTEENKPLVSAEDLEDWEAAIDEWYSIHNPQDS